MNSNLSDYNGFVDFQIKNKKDFPIVKVIDALTIGRTAFYDYRSKPYMFNIETILELSDIYDVDPLFLTNLILKDIENKNDTPG